jgi:hypothetical protein
MRNIQIAAIAAAGVLALGAAGLPGAALASQDRSPAPAAPAASQAAWASPPGPTDPWAVVSTYYADIESQNYPAAFALIDNGATTGQSYGEFVAGFADTGAQTVSEVSESGDQVSFNLAAVDLATGGTQFFTGTDTVVNGVIVQANVIQTG